LETTTTTPNDLISLATELQGINSRISNLVTRKKIVTNMICELIRCGNNTTTLEDEEMITVSSRPDGVVASAPEVRNNVNSGNLSKGQINIVHEVCDKIDWCEQFERQGTELRERLKYIYSYLYTRRNERVEVMDVLKYLVNNTTTYQHFDGVSNRGNRELMDTAEYKATLRALNLLKNKRMITMGGSLKYYIKINNIPDNNQGRLNREEVGCS